MENTIKKWRDSLTNEERWALEDYTGKRFSDINNHLRGLVPNSEMEPLIKEIDSALSKFSFPKEMTVYRSQGANIPNIFLKTGKKVTIEAIMASYQYVNSVIPYKNYISTTLKQQVAINHIDYLKDNTSSEFFLLINGLLPANSCCGALSLLSVYPNEDEVLIMRNKQFNVTDVTLYDTFTINLSGNFNEMEETI